MKIDIFPPIFPRTFYERMVRVSAAGQYMQKRTRGIPVLTDLDLGLRIMDRYEGYVQVLTLASPPVEALGDPALTAELARLANDGMAEIVASHPDRFPGFVASLPMNNPEAALREIDRAIGQLGATGVQMFSNVNGRALDAPEYQPIVDRMAAHGLPIWMHPARQQVAVRSTGKVTRQKRMPWVDFGWSWPRSHVTWEVSQCKK